MDWSNLMQLKDGCIILPSKDVVDVVGCSRVDIW